MLVSYYICMLNLLVCGDPSFTGTGRFSKAGSW